MDIMDIIELIKFMTFTEASRAYIDSQIDDDTYNAYGFVWATSADRGTAYADFMTYPESKRSQDIITALQQSSPHPYAGAY
jgi:hypothetical protein